MQAAINKFDSKRDSQKQDVHERTGIVDDTVNHSLKQADATIEQKEPQITNQIQDIALKENERSEKGSGTCSLG